MPRVIQAYELNTHSATLKPVLATESPGIEVKMLSCLHRQSTHMHSNIKSKMYLAGLRSEHFNTNNKRVELKCSKAPALTEAPIQGTQRENHSGP